MLLRIILFVNIFFVKVTFCFSDPLYNLFIVATAVTRNITDDSCLANIKVSSYTQLCTELHKFNYEKPACFLLLSQNPQCELPYVLIRSYDENVCCTENEPVA